VPGCGGEGGSRDVFGKDVCIKPNALETKEVTFVGNPCNADGTPCEVCTGDCDRDSDCAGSLRCAQRGRRDGKENVPGCDWGEGSDSIRLDNDDFCFEPETVPDTVNYVGECSSGGYQCKECEGDCDDNDDCEGDLICLQRSGFESVPGCSGEGGSRDLFGKDICVTRESQCFTEFTIKVDEGTCSGDEFLEGIQAAIENSRTCSGIDAEDVLKRVTGKRNVDSAIEFVDDLCAEKYQEMIDGNSLDAGWPIKASDDELKVTAFYDGDTDANWERQTNDGKYELEDDFARIDSYYDYVQKKPVEFPDYTENFEDCEYRAAYCCWVQDRQAGDNNGNCDTPYDTNCVDADPGDNTDLCYVDMEKAPQSARVAGGYAVFPDDDEGAVHCHGLAWGNDAGLDDVYKGNNLFYVAMYDHLYQRGYVRNVPGAPMCACAEKMPVVSRADCTEMDITQRVDYKYTDGALTLLVRNISVDFNACNGANNNNNDLEAYYERLVDEGRADEEELEQLQTQLVGDCEGPLEDFIDSI